MDITATLVDIFSYIVQAIFLYFLGSFIIGFLLNFLHLMVKAKEQSPKEDISNDFTKKLHFVYIEKHGEIYYWFDGKEGSFLAQGKTLPETLSHLKERFPTDIFFAKINGDTYQISAPDWIPRKPISTD